MPRDERRGDRRMLEDGDREDRKRNIDKEEERRHKLSRTEKDLGRTTRSNRSGSSVKDTVNIQNLDPDNPEDLIKFLGFSKFKSTKNKKVPGNNAGAVDIRSKRKYEQKLHKRKLYEIPLTRQELAAKQAETDNQMQS